MSVKKTLQYQIAPDLPTVTVDSSTIYEVLVNLIENAVKYTYRRPRDHSNL